jgi:predicted flap endonuclease-1-like 5' DNA nuclease
MGANYIQLMAILQKLKSLLGFDDAGSERGNAQEVGVTVEREREGDDERERPVASDAEPSDETDETVVAETDAAASTDSMTEPSDVPHEPAEPAEATGPSQTDAAPTEEKLPDQSSGTVAGTQEDTAEPEPELEPELEIETEPEPEPEVEAESEPETEPEPEPKSAEDEPAASTEPAEGTSEPVVVIKGIGPAYAERMADAGVETVADLAAADADELESQTEISAKRIQGWIDRAKVR